MTVIAGFSVAAADIPFGQALSATQTRLELTQFVPVDESFVPFFWKERDGDTEAFERHARDHPAVETLERVDGRVESALYRVTWTDAGRRRIERLTTDSVALLDAVTTDECWRLRVLAVDRCELARVQTVLEGFGAEPRCRRIRDGVERSDATALTDDQRETLTTAFERGYYEVPRAITGTELADQFGISHQALSERLRRAHANLVGETIRAE